MKKRARRFQQAVEGVRMTREVDMATGRRLSAACFITVLMAVLWMPAENAFGQTGGKIVPMRVSTHFTNTDPPGKGFSKLVELIRERSKGRIRPQVWYSSELGDERENVEMVRDGSIEMTSSLTTSAARYVAQLAVFDFPLLYTDDFDMLKKLRAVRPYVAQLLAPHNMIPLGAVDVGFRYVLNKARPINKVADLKGIKIRVPSVYYKDLFAYLGASATVLPWSEIYMALQTGVVDGMEAPPSLIYAMRFHEQAKYLSKTNHIGSTNYFLVNKKWYEQLSAEDRNLIAEAADEAATYHFKVQNEATEDYTKKIEAAGIKVNDVSGIDEFRKVLTEFCEHYGNKQGPAWMELYNRVRSVK